MGEVELCVTARDEFGRFFHADRRVPKTWVEAIHGVDVAAIFFPRLVSDILRMMGTEARATWSGNTGIPFERATADEQ